jgi:Tol biopolymer transport system component
VIGRALGPYEVVAKLGEGGMGEVYRATDTRLKRQVAIKILPASLAADPDRLARFQREAEVLAALNHPNIAQIYGLETSNGTTALVMELVEGEDLSAIIARHRHSAPAAAAPSESASRGAAASGGGAPRALNIEDALPIARQIADALEAAHEQGIIHRDLKPANVKVRADGTVKVLDFGLAKALGPEGSTATAGPGVSQSPTITTPAMTAMGMILGTAAYMSPEQAKGRAVDKRADIWAFGCVLFEMLTGDRCFAAEDVSETLAAVLRQDVDWAALPASTPPRLQRLLARCLDRDPRTRLRDIGEARVEIASIEAGAPDAMPAPATMATVPAWRRALPWALATLGLGAALVSMALWAPWRATPIAQPRTLLTRIGVDGSLRSDAGRPMGADVILSPDATTLAFVARGAGQPQDRLFVQKLDQLQASPLAGTEGATIPFFSPDGQWIAFFADGRLKKIPVTGGAPIDLCAAGNGRGGTWTDDGSIIFTPRNGVNTSLMRVPASGGTPEPFGSLSEGAVTQRWPQALPGGAGVLYTEHSAVFLYEEANLVVAPLAGGTAKVVVRGGYFGRYVPGGPSSPTSGHLIYMSQGTVFAVPFDLARLETIGPAVPALDAVASTSGGGVRLALSADGTLVYVPDAAPAAHAIDWVTRDGTTSRLHPDSANWANPRFSPDGRTLAVDISDGKQRDIWLYDWTHDTLRQLTFGPSDDRLPLWTPDGRRLVFASDQARAGVFNLYWKPADGSGEATRLTDSPEIQVPSSWHPSGRFLAFLSLRARPAVMILPMSGDEPHGWTPGEPTVLVEGGPGSWSAFSPDGRWIAYVQGGDVYVRPFPGPGGPWRVSTAGGGSPVWSATTRELLFPGGDATAPSTIMTAAYSIVGDSFRAETPRVWSPVAVERGNVDRGNAGRRGEVTPGQRLNWAFDLHPDGKRIVASTTTGQEQVQDHVVFVFNFRDYLATIAPGRP